MTPTERAELFRVPAESIETCIGAAGTVIPERLITVRALHAGHVEFLAGDRIRQGALIVRLEADELLASRRAAMAAVQSAGAALSNARVRFAT